MRNRVCVAILAAVSVTVVSCGGSTSQSSGGAKPKHHPPETNPATAGRRVALRTYHVGECVTLPPESASSTKTKTVACTKPHDLEIAGQATVGADVVDYPSTDEWKVLITQLCDPVVAQYLGGTIDPRGRFLTKAIHPLQTMWDLTTPHSLDCAVATRPQRQVDFDHPPRLTGAARGATQTFTFPVGSCIPIPASGGIALPVECSEPHSFEVTGVADIAGRIDHLPGAHELDAFLGPTCSTFAVQYLGHPLDGDLTSWLTIGDQSWNAGRRQMECLVAHGPVGQHSAVSGSIRSGA